MERWKGKVAMVTGASSGIGAAIARQLTLNGMKVVGLARRVEMIQDISASLKDAPGKLYGLRIDITKEEDILYAFKWVKENLGGVDVMVNNAGVVFLDKLTEGKTADWRHMFDVNVLGLSICTREAIKSMKEKDADGGHIIHINSISPGAVMTEVWSKIDLPEELLELIKDIPLLQSEDLAEAIVFALSRPPHVQIHEIVIHPTGEQ